MIQLALGIDPEPLSMAPFIVAAHDLPPATAKDFGVAVHPRAPAVIFPSLGAYVGADIVAGMLATGLVRDKRLRLFIDVGTNSEIALGSHDRVLATAAPAGPAFEAAQIRCGMRAAEGAIEGVKISGDAIELQVIGDTDPVGICGSGLVDCVAELVGAGLLDHSGRFVPEETAADIAPALAERLTKIGEERVFMLADNVYLSQRDVRELQFAKASIATGWHILMNELGVGPEDISQVLLAGSFGAYLSPASAISIGLVPRMALPRIVSAGNVASEGAKMAALSVRERAEARSLDRTRSSTSSCPAARTSTTCSSTSWRSRDDQDRSSPAARSRSTSRRSRAASVSTCRCSRCPPCCTTGPELIAPAVKERAGGARRRRGGVRRLRHLRRARRGARRRPAARGRALLRRARRASTRRPRSRRSPARTCSPTSSRARSSTP